MISDIQPVNLAALDLNLLVVLDAVLSTQSATVAASRLHLTQPAVSNAIKRARQIFHDELVIRNGSGFSRTPMGDALAPNLRRVLVQVEGLLVTSSDALSPRSVTIACLDAVGIVLLPELLPRLQERLPAARMIVEAPDSGTLGNLAHSNIDLIVGAVPEIPHGCDSEDLMDDPLVVLASAKNPRIKSRLSAKVYAELPHIELAVLGKLEDRVDRALSKLNYSRTVEVSVPHLSTIPFLVANSHRIATTTRSFARRFVDSLDLKLHRPPVSLAPLRMKMVWHRRRASDPTHVLLRDLLRSLAAQMATKD